MKTRISTTDKKRRRVGFVFLLLLASGLARAQEKAAPPQPIRRESMVAMRDGVKLATTAFLPEEKGSWPVILVRTPYNQDGVTGFAGECTKRGYVLVAQDCRGRYKSEGEYVPFKTDREDGYDSVEWAATQEWSNGKVGLWGGSALGITSNLAAAAAPPHLLCAYVIVAPSSWRFQSLWMGGLYRKEMIDGWMAAQNSTKIREDWTSRPVMDPYFDSYEIYPDHKRIRIPMYNVAGWYDIFLQGGIDNFTGLQARGGKGARGNQKLLVAAVAHGPLTSRFSYPKNSSDLGGADQWRWFAHWLKGEDNGIEKDPPIRYYLMGDAEDKHAPGNVWLTAESWPPRAEKVAWYLHADGSLSTTKPKVSGSSTHFVYDPKNPAPTAGGANLVFAKKGPVDQREIGDRPDYARFNSEPLAEPLTVVGPISVELYVSTDAPDTDFVAKLVDVYPDGYEALLQDSGLRLRYRKGFKKEKMMKPGKIEKVTIDLWSTANVFNKGHRIGVHISSSNDPRFDPNPNTGKPLRADNETRTAKNVFYHERWHASRILLPVAKDLLKKDSAALAAK